MSKVSMYFHSGSKNHGCEAIVRGTASILNDVDIKLFSSRVDEDVLYAMDKICELSDSGKDLIRFSPRHIAYKIVEAITKNKNLLYDYKYSKVIKEAKEQGIFMSIGGDNYCYDDHLDILKYLNKKINSTNSKTVLWGCSIDEKLLNRCDLVNDLKLYSHIVTRESLTYNALINAGIVQNVHLYPDPAFALDKTLVKLPKGFNSENTIGINVSPLITRLDNGNSIAMKNYIELVRYILSDTEYKILLIPHVLWESNDDRIALSDILDVIGPTDRIRVINDYNANELKGIISQLRFFVCARTHASIAAYSSLVPTLVIGYSIKARGIALDLFGTHEKYVIPVQSLKNNNDIVNGFTWLINNENEIRLQLKTIIPKYIKKAKRASDVIASILSESNE
ncbi:MAG: polysaccharide pyruvyl transferase family protein [Clostridiales bacterium]|nr:polysaccharide pyruvyl transferase family protein [Clostridiales bacterium]